MPLTRAPIWSMTTRRSRRNSRSSSVNSLLRRAAAAKVSVFWKSVKKLKRKMVKLLAPMLAIFSST